LYLIPGDPAIAALGPEASVDASAEQLQELRVKFGTDKPLIAQYFNQLGGILHGDLGHSFRTDAQVSTMLAQALPSTLALAAGGLLVGIIFGVLLAVATTFTKKHWLQQLFLALPPIAVSMPTFWIGLMLLQVFSFQLGWFPVIGGSELQRLVLPVLSLAIPVGAIIAQVLSKSLETTLSEPYAQVIEAKGASRLRLFFGHALKNATIPALTITGVLVGSILGGSVLIETVFSRNGLGQLIVTAVTYKDLPVVQGIVLFSATAFVFSSLVVDLLYPVIDSRIRLGAKT
jgi:peptide/nickel transport system permease protein